jgi:hypothetical protein
MEISAGPAAIFNNVVTYNNPGNTAGKGGISIKDSKNVEVYNNTLGHNNKFGLRAGVDLRINCGPPNAGCGYVLSNVNFHDNTMALDKVVGCGVGVLCNNNI